MDDKHFGAKLQSGEISLTSLVRDTAVDDVDGMVAFLSRHVPAEDIRRALYDRIAAAPLDEFETLKSIYMKLGDV
jgi:hypothetical protein